MALFAHTTFPTLVKVAETFPDCVFPAYADNMAVVGKLSVAAQATAALDDSLKQELGLEDQPRDSQIFSSSWPSGANFNLVSNGPSKSIFAAVQ